MEFNSVEETIVKKAVTDSGWMISSIVNNCEYICTNSYFRELATIKKLKDNTFGLHFSRELKSPDFLKVIADIPKDGEFYIFKTSDSWTATNLLKRAAELFSVLPDNPLEEYKKKLAEFSDKEIQKTEAERIVKERVGQDIYRNALIKYWQGSCAVTGCTLNEALRASHAKPWKDCSSDAERLNVYNGFLLTPNLDALFDKGYISFTDEGLIMISSSLYASDIQGLGISRNMKLRWIEKEHLEFLDYHHKNVWKN